MPKRDSIQEKINLMMNPMENLVTKDHFKVLLLVVPRSQTSFMSVEPIESTENYEALKEACSKEQARLAAKE